MQHVTTLLTPSAALPGLLSQAYNAEKQLERYENLREKSTLAATEGNLEAAHRHFKAQAADVLALLDNEEISDTPPMPTFKATLQRFGIDVRSPGKSEFWRVVEAAARSTSVRKWDARLQIEAFEATERRWFLVFDTVTYDPTRFGDDVMFGRYWRRYQRSVQHAVVRRAHGSLRRFRASGRSFADHVRYFAVPEAHKDGRTHLHILWFLSHLPDVCSESDPNGHCTLTPRRQVDGWPAYPYGMITMRLPVRYRGDAFTVRLGWRVPLDNDGKRPILKDSVAVARYVAKYLSKPKPETLKCRRIRTSPPPGPPVHPGEIIDAQQSPVVPPVPSSPSGESSQGFARDPNSQVPPSHPDSSGADYPVSEQPSDPVQWTDEDYVRYAQRRFGHQFTPAAARAFSDFDPSSRDVQAAEFYKYADEHFIRYGYF